MSRAVGGVSSVRQRIVTIPQILTGPQALAFLPAISLASFWFGGETALIVAALAVPLIIGALGIFSKVSRAPRDGSAMLTDVNMRDRLIEALEGGLGISASNQRSELGLLCRGDRRIQIH